MESAYACPQKLYVPDDDDGRRAYNDQESPTKNISSPFLTEPEQYPRSPFSVTKSSTSESLNLAQLDAYSNPMPNVLLNVAPSASIRINFSTVFHRLEF